MEKMSDALRTYQRKHLHVVSSTPPKPPVEQEYECPTCKDRGYLRADVPFGDPLFGKPVECVCKRADKKERMKQNLLSLSGIVQYSRYRTASFETFNRKLPGKSVKSAYANAKTFAAEPDGWLVLAGPYGCGKTHLAVSIAKERIAAGDTVLVQTVPDLLDHLREAFDPHVEATYSGIFEQMKTAGLLVLDDYGAENTTEWAKEKLFQILNYRYNTMAPTVITTNVLGKIDERIRSRLSDGELVNLVEMDDANDYRPTLKKQIVVDMEASQ
jgi:DNA replication protein DnaC